MERRDRTGTRRAPWLGRANIRAAWWMIGASMAVGAVLGLWSFGGPVPLSGTSHWAEGTRSGGVEAAMDPTLTVGKRKNFTPLDFAGLDDIGWDVLPPPVTTGSIAGTVWNDLDSDGVKDTGEAALSNWRVFIDADSGARSDTKALRTTTGSSSDSAALSDCQSNAVDNRSPL